MFYILLNNMKMIFFKLTISVFSDKFSPFTSLMCVNLFSLTYFELSTYHVFSLLLSPYFLSSMGLINFIYSSLLLTVLEGAHYAFILLLVSLNIST